MSLRARALTTLLLAFAVAVSPASLMAVRAQQPGAPVVPATAPTASNAEQAAARLLQTADWPRATIAYRDLVASEAQNSRAWFGWGVALHESGKYDQARDALRKAAALGYPQVLQLRYRLARTLAKLGDAAGALDELDQLAANGLTNPALLTSPDLAALQSSPRFTAVVARVTQNAHPCAADPNFRRFDFWIGQWDVQQTGVPRAPIGSGASSAVERILDGCVILENWTPLAGPAGKSFNTFNTVTKHWEQYWVDATGRITHYIGDFKDDGNLYYEADQFGTTNRIRMTFFKQGADQVRQLGHVSTDGGQTWTGSFDLTYVRKK